jgi:large subunit ribosomal protein L22
MAFGTKTNERPGVRAQARYLRVSAYKAREVLDLIRGESVPRALEILEFCERDVAQPVGKCLESAVANAEHNNGLPADELFVSACFADEGPTLKRWRPRAKGRATRIRKRTCHITVIVSRLSPEELDRLREREASSGRGRSNRAAADARRERVARSREAKAERKAADAEAEAEHDHDHDHDHDHGDEGTAPAAATVEAEASEADLAEGDALTAESAAEPQGDDAVAEADTAEEHDADEKKDES